MPYIHFSEQEKQMANEADIVSYLHSIGESTERHGREHWWESPSGKVSIKGSDWYSQYERVGGGAVGFLQKFYGMKYPDAVRTLLGQEAGKELIHTPRHQTKEKDKKPFVIPKKHTDMRRVYAYLTGERMIDREVIYAFERKGLIFEDAEYHNVVFVGVDENGLPKHIQKRSTSSASSFKGNVDSSNANYSFNYVGTSDKLFVFEAPIDMLAYITLFKSNWKEHSYVALCSTAECAAVQMLKNHPNITNVYLCLDHDSAGIEGAIRLADILREMGSYALWRVMPKYKDWDEDLKALRGRDASPSSEHLGLENIKRRCAELFEIDVEDDEIYLEFLNSKGYLLEQTFGKLRCLLGKIELTEDAEQRQELLFQMANTAVAYCFCRDWQMNNSCGIDKYTELIKKEYKPYRDKQRSCDQLEDLKQGLASLEKEMKATDTFTNQECCEQNKKMCRLGMLAIRLDGTIGRERDAELAKAQAQEFAM